MGAVAPAVGQGIGVGGADLAIGDFRVVQSDLSAVPDDDAIEGGRLCLPTDEPVLAGEGSVLVKDLCLICFLKQGFGHLVAAAGASADVIQHLDNIHFLHISGEVVTVSRGVQAGLDHGTHIGFGPLADRHASQNLVGFLSGQGLQGIVKVGVDLHGFRGGELRVGGGAVLVVNQTEQRGQQCLGGDIAVWVKAVAPGLAGSGLLSGQGAHAVHDAGPAHIGDGVIELHTDGGTHLVDRHVVIEPHAVIIDDGVVAVEEESQIIAVEGIIGPEGGKGLTAVGDAGGQPPVDGVFRFGIGSQIGEVVKGEQTGVAAAVIGVGALSGGVFAHLQGVAAGL